MKPTHRFRYALKALVDLVLHQGRGPVTVGAIAKRQSIPVHSLEQLFNRMRRSGLVKAERGPRGGYRLARPADKITVRELFELFDSSRKGFSPSEKTNGADPARSIWQQVEKAVHTTLEAATLQMLADQMRDKVTPPVQHRYMFHI